MKLDAYDLSGPTVRLSHQDDLYLIVRRATGIFYTNQVAGTYCFQAAEEGVLVPLGGVASQVLEGLQAVMTGEFELTPGHADGIDRVLKTNRYTQMLSVDRARIGESEEAWVYVDIGPHPDRWDPNDIGRSYQVFFGLGPGKGVLTWQNSD